MDKSSTLVFAALAAAVNFGFWQQSVFAGIFMFCALVVIDQRS